MNLSTATRLAAVVFVAAGVCTIPAAAHAVAVCEPSTCARPAAAVDPGAASPYAEALSALGGRSLAQVLADHQARVLGPVPA